MVASEVPDGAKYELRPQENERHLELTKPSQAEIEGTRKNDHNERNNM